MSHITQVSVTSIERFLKSGHSNGKLFVLISLSETLTYKEFFMCFALKNKYLDNF